MTDSPAIPADDLTRQATITDPDSPDAQHIAVVGDTYTVVLSGENTGGRFAMIDMLVPAGSGPPPHRHDFDETFHVSHGQLEVTFRGKTTLVTEGQTANIPANAPHSFRNTGDEQARLLCVVSPAGLEEFFAAVGDPVATRTSPPPDLTDAEQHARMDKATKLAPAYKQEILPPPAGSTS